MRHRYECPMRWADLDALGHVNNVVYVDYLQEARVDFMRALATPSRDDLAEGVVVVRHEVAYRAPLQFSFRPVSIESWVTEVRAATFTVAYEVFHDDDTAEGGRHVYLRATTVLTPFVFAEERPRRLSADEKAVLAPYVEPPWEPAARIEPVDPERHFTSPLQVRFSDVDVYRHVNNVVYFEYLQESRIRFFAEAMGTETRPAMVVAQTDVDYHRPLLLRAEPYEIRSTVQRLGRRATTFVSAIVDPLADPTSRAALMARARVTMVSFDLATGHSTESPPAMRAALLPYAVEVV